MVSASLNANRDAFLGELPPGKPHVGDVDKVAVGWIAEGRRCREYHAAEAG